MADNPVFERFREISWRRALTDAERAELESWLANNPKFRAEWEAEMALSSSLRRLPQPAVPSNFTARVLRAVERETVSESHAHATAGWWRALAGKARWMVGSSFAAVAVILGLVIHEQQARRQQEFQAQARRQHELALMNSLKIISDVPVLPNTEVLANFETIRRLNQAPPPDEQLLALLE
jgi:anti-sigma factor RsiW